MKNTPDQDLPSPGELLFKEISEEERRRIYKNLPFPAIRNRTLLELRERGARIKALSEVSGLGRAAIRRIVKGEKAKREKAEK
jgi:hypothetical protein